MYLPPGSFILADRDRSSVLLLFAKRKDNVMFKKKKEALKQDLILGCAAIAFMAFLIAASMIEEAAARRG